jgi:HSP20 family protein
MAHLMARPYGGWLGIDVNRGETGYSVEIPVAGFKPEEIDVTLDQQVLTVTGRAERRQFTRSLMLSDEIDPEAVTAKVENGMLYLTLNFHPKAQPKKIAVSSG